MVQLQRPIAIYIRRVSETVGKVAVTSAETLAIHMVASSRATHINIYHQRMFAVVEQLHQMRVGLSIHITASTATRVVDNNKQLTALAVHTNSEQITEKTSTIQNMHSRRGNTLIVNLETLRAEDDREDHHTYLDQAQCSIFFVNSHPIPDICISTFFQKSQRWSPCL